MSYQADLVFLELQHGNLSQLILVYGSFHLYVYMIKTDGLICCGRQEEPAILISRLVLRMRRTYVVSICLDFH